MATGWFYKFDGVENGPMPSSEIRRLADDGVVTPETQLRKADSSKWIEASQIKGLFPEQVEENLPDPLLAMGSQAAGAVAGAAGSAAKAVGNWFAKKPDKQAAEPVDAEAKVREKIAGILMAGEEIAIVAIQAKPIANWMPDCICLTDKRLIFYRVKLLGRVDFEDFIWRDLHDAKVVENIVGATFSVTVTGGKGLSIDYLPRDDAKAVYRFAQQQEERSLEERRQRTLEDKRSQAGGVTVQMGQQPSAPAADDPMGKLQKLKAMADAGLITAAEYEAKKADILSKM